MSSFNPSAATSSSSITTSTSRPPCTPTYRHLLPSSLSSPHNPLRVIAHCDIDAAYAQFEQVRLSLPPSIPLICAQWQSIIAVNYPARAFGIKRFNTIEEAKKMCPDLYVQHVATYRNGESEAGYWDDEQPDPRTHKVSLDVYRRESGKILAVFKEMVPRGEIEKASIDEAFLDLSILVNERLLAHHPQLAQPPSLEQGQGQGQAGIDAPLPPAPSIYWDRVGNVVPIPGTADDGEVAENEEERCRDTWEDWALYYGAEIMGELRAEVFKRLQYTCSAGIAHGKAFAKLCSAWKKPNAQTVLRAAATPAFLRDMDFTDIRFLGGKLGTAIATEFDAKTVGDLLTISLEELQRRFGEEAVWVYNVIRGVDHSEVTPRLSTKSMLASKNTRPPVTTPSQGSHWIGILAGELHVRLKEAREIAPGLWPKTLVLGHRTGIESARHRQIPFPYTRNLSVGYIQKYAERLWAEVCQPMYKGGMKLNNMSLSFTGLERMEEGQKGIEGFFSAATAPVKAVESDGMRNALVRTSKDSLSSSVDNTPSPVPTTAAATAQADVTRPNKKPRLETLRTGSRKPLDGFLVKPGQSSTAKPSSDRASPAIGRTSTAQPVVFDVRDDEDDGTKIEVTHSDPGIWKCPRCGLDIRVEPGASNNSATVDTGKGDEAEGGAALQVRLDAMKQEHEDYHFALDLQDGPSPNRSKTNMKGGSRGNGSGSGSGSGNNTTNTAGRGGEKNVKAKGTGKVKKMEGIKAFFAPKTSSSSASASSGARS